MSGSLLTERIAVPYATGLFQFAVVNNAMYKITADFQNLDIFFSESSELLDYLNNPVVSQKARREVLTKTLKSEISTETFNFLMILLDHDRINILSAVIRYYFKLMYITASVRVVEVYTAIKLTTSQKNKLISKLKEMLDARDIQLTTVVDPTLIGGVLIKAESSVLDLTVKNRLQQLAKHLNTVLEI